MKTDSEYEKYVVSPSAAYLTAREGLSDFVASVFGFLVRGAAGLNIFLILALLIVVWSQAQPAIEKFGSDFLTNQIWNVDGENFGAAPYIYGSLVSSCIALIFAVPIGIAVAILTSEETLLPDRLRAFLAFTIELIAAIPSVIIGLWGIYVMIPATKPFQMWLFQKFVKIPFFSTEPSGPSMLAAGLILAIMSLPTIAAISRDILITVPPELNSASMALGATTWETIFRVKLPVAATGIIGAIMLGLGRSLGETMAVTMVIGNSAQINISLLDPAYTIPSVLANEFAEALNPLHIGALMYLALILFLLTLVVNFLALLLVKLVQK